MQLQTWPTATVSSKDRASTNATASTSATCPTAVSTAGARRLHRDSHPAPPRGRRNRAQCRRRNRLQRAQPDPLGRGYKAKPGPVHPMGRPGAARAQRSHRRRARQCVRRIARVRRAQHGQADPGNVFRVDPPNAVTKLWEGIEVTNGMGFSPDASLLYHCDSTTKAVWAYDVTGDRRLKDRRVFGKLPEGWPDGMAVDVEGGVWVAVVRYGEVVRFKANGTVERRIKIRQRW